MPKSPKQNPSPEGRSKPYSVDRATSQNADKKSFIIKEKSKFTFEESDRNVLSHFFINNPELVGRGNAR